jgi:hypothetical protein
LVLQPQLPLKQAWPIGEAVQSTQAPAVPQLAASLPALQLPF